MFNTRASARIGSCTCVTIYSFHTLDTMPLLNDASDAEARANFEPWGGPPTSKWPKSKLQWAIKALGVPGSKGRDNKTVLCSLLEGHILMHRDNLLSSDRHRSLIADTTTGSLETAGAPVPGSKALVPHTSNEKAQLDELASRDDSEDKEKG